MKVVVLAIGRPALLFRDAILEYERRAAHYWTLDVIEVKEEKAGRNLPPERVRAVEADRLLERVPPGLEVFALTRTGEAWSSERLAQHLQQRALASHPGTAFLIGGAFGLGETALAQATRRLSLSAFTLPHELARLFLAEQLYRAGSIARGEPYHKAVQKRESRGQLE
ncbi:MAG: 23S rRNA (pseudouridine(1915)-N(3))-methyltransferase RlmH [Gemmatimonadota bacterium]